MVIFGKDWRKLFEGHRNEEFGRFTLETLPIELLININKLRPVEAANLFKEAEEAGRFPSSKEFKNNRERYQSWGW